MILQRKLIEAVGLNIPGLPDGLEGLRVVHLTDPHARWWRRRQQRRAAAELRLLRADLAVLTGDFVDREGDEQVGVQIMEEICDSLRCPLGVYGVFGNHDTPLARELMEKLPVRWLHNRCVQVEGLPLEILGFDTGPSRRPDVLTALETLKPRGRNGEARAENQNLRILLSHLPTYLPTASDLGVDLMFAGHTHGGQFRVPGWGPFFNSTDWPMALTSGVMRHRRTLCVVSRGMGEAGPPFRLFCPAHIPVCTLRRGPMPGRPTEQIENVMPW